MPLLDALDILAAVTDEGFLAQPGLPDVRVRFAVRGAGSKELLAAFAAAAGVTVTPGNPHWVAAAGKAPAGRAGGRPKAPAKRSTSASAPAP